MAQQQSVQMLQERLAYEQNLVQLVDRIHSAKSIDSIFIELQGEILELLDADRMTIYAVDAAKNETLLEVPGSRYRQGDPPPDQREEHRGLRGRLRPDRQHRRRL